MNTRVSLRKLGSDDFAQAHALGSEAFGGPPPGSPAPTGEGFPPPGRHYWGAFDDDRLLARVVGFEFGSWFRGTTVATCGIAGVAVTAERRGEGLLGPLFEAVLDEAAGRGEVISTLFPTANGIYRPFGYELIGSYDTVAIPSAQLAGVRPPTATRTRRATAADLRAVKAVYAAWSGAQNGPLTRTGPGFGATDEEVVADFTGISLAVDADDRVVGYASWERGQGYDSDAVLTISDLLATTADGYRALWRLLGSFASVVGSVRLSTSGQDPARLVLPTATWDVVGRHPYMLRVDDVAGALSGLPAALPLDVRLVVGGDRLGRSDGCYRLTATDGFTACERAEAPAVADDVPALSPQGLALLYAGAQSCGNLRLTTHLVGGTRADDVALDALLGGRQVHIRDYF